MHQNIDQIKYFHNLFILTITVKNRILYFFITWLFKVWDQGQQKQMIQVWNEKLVHFNKKNQPLGHKTAWNNFIFCVAGKLYLLSNVEVSAGGGGVKRDPALIVGLVDAGPMLHQEGHHVYIIIYAGLKKKMTRVKASVPSSRLTEWLFQNSIHTAYSISVTHGSD